MTQILDDELTQKNEFDLNIFKAYRFRHKLYAFIYLLLSVVLGAYIRTDLVMNILDFLKFIPYLNDWLFGYFFICLVMALIYFKTVWQSIGLTLILGIISFAITLGILTFVVFTFNLSQDFLPVLALLGGLLIIAISFFIPQKYQKAYVKASTR